MASVITNQPKAEGTADPNGTLLNTQPTDKYICCYIRRNCTCDFRSCLAVFVTECCECVNTCVECLNECCWDENQNISQRRNYTTNMSRGVSRNYSIRSTNSNDYGFTDDYVYDVGENYDSGDYGGGNIDIGNCEDVGSGYCCEDTGTGDSGGGDCGGGDSGGGDCGGGDSGGGDCGGGDSGGGDCGGGDSGGGDCGGGDSGGGDCGDCCND